MPTYQVVVSETASGEIIIDRAVEADGIVDASIQVLEAFKDDPRVVDADAWDVTVRQVPDA